MRKKNILTAAVSLSLVACLSIGATLAYFTDKTDTKTNVFTAGHVEIDLVDFGGESTTDSDDLVYGTKNNQGGYTYEGLVPGDTVKKNVKVIGMPGTQSAYVAVKVSNDDAMVSSSDFITMITKALQDAQQVNNWEAYNVGAKEIVLVAKEPVSAYSEKILFNTIQIPTTWGNEVTDETFSISVEAYAAQSDNLSYDEFVTMAKKGASSFEAYVK